MKPNTTILAVNQEVEILEFGRIVHGVVKEILKSKLANSRPVKVRIRSGSTKSGTTIVAKKLAHVYPRGIIKTLTR